MSHPLDRPVWSALTTGQAHLAQGHDLALRFPADHGPFAAMARQDSECEAALVDLVPPGSQTWMIEHNPPALPAGLSLVSSAPINQMWLKALTPAPRSGIEILPLGEDDATEMLALATLTRPGPFVARTHRLGRFVGIRQDDHLIAMAGERMKPAGFTEVSAVCTHPDARGRGYAGLLMREVIGRILARGELAFLHTYPDNAPAIALYEALGFSKRQDMTVLIYQRA
jgi:predicted GNAT family acetyltransferase